MDFSETVVVYDIKVDRCSQLNEFMKLYEYQRSRSVHWPWTKSLRFNILNFFSSITTWPIEARFYMEPPWNGGAKAYSNGFMVWFCFTAVQHILGHSGAVSYLTTLFLRKPPNQFISTWCTFFSPVTDNCSSWISGRGRMAVEIISWPNLHGRMCQMWGSNSGPPACQGDMLPTELPYPAYSNGRGHMTKMAIMPIYDKNL